ncbi:MAG: integrase/recombinase XerD [Verrucomicrobiales bacterium]|jgi:integrase
MTEDVSDSAELVPTDQDEDRLLTAAEFQGLADVPPEVEWFANILNKHTKRAYMNDVKDFMRFVGIKRPEEFRIVTRSHVIAWRMTFETRGKDGKPLAASTARRKLSALSSLFEHLCNHNAVTHNPIKGVQRPSEGANEGKTPALGDDQMRPRRTRSRANAIGPFLPSSSTTGFAVRSWLVYVSGTSKNGAA